MISPVHHWIAEKTGLKERLTPALLEEWQLEKLNQAVDYARKNCRFYHNLPQNFRSIVELPFTTPADIAKEPMDLLAVAPAAVARITTLMTSGTTGIQKRVFFTESDIERIRQYFAVGMKSLVSAGQTACILISDTAENSLGYLLKQALERLEVKAEVVSPVQSVEIAVAAAREAGCIIGMPAEVLYMCRVNPELRPKSILLTADYVPESIIRALNETWQTEVFCHYGMTEAGFGYAVDCYCHEGHHTRDADFLVEIIDPFSGKVCREGETGEVVLSLFANEAMPLIRYRTGDLSNFIPGPCGCGSTLRKLGRIQSRFMDDILLAGRKTLSIRLLDEILFALPEVRGFDAAITSGEDNNCLCLLLDSVGIPDLASLRSYLPVTMDLNVQFSENDPFSHRGKRKLHRDLSQPVFAGFRTFGH